MLKMSVFQLGVVLVALCLSTQVVALNTTTSVNTTVTKAPTTMATNTYSSSNTTTPTGAGVPLQGGSMVLLAPLLIALHRYC